MILYLLRLWGLATAPTTNTLTTFAQTRGMKSDQFGHRICGALCMWSDRRAGGVLGGTPGCGKRHSGLPGPLHTHGHHLLTFWTSSPPHFFTSPVCRLCSRTKGLCAGKWVSVPRLRGPGATWQFQGAQEWMPGTQDARPTRRVEVQEMLYMLIWGEEEFPSFPFHWITPSASL